MQNILQSLHAVRCCIKGIKVKLHTDMKVKMCLKRDIFAR